MAIHPSTIALITMLVVLFIGGAVIAEDSGLWNDETINGTITQTNTDLNVCIGDTCYNGWQLSIKDNASIAGSEICTAGNGLCGTGGTNMHELRFGGVTSELLNLTSETGTHEVYFT